MKNNILVVDDQEINRDLINILIGQYSKEKNILLNVFSVDDGDKAVEMCENENIDIIFMDLSMPRMQGDEATKIIKDKYPMIMVVVISSQDSEQEQQKMLHNGAEDYIIKPVNGPIFKSRLHNYLQIIQTRNKINYKAKAYNLFSSKIYNYHMDFCISNETDLSEFWEAILIRLDFQKQVEKVSDLIYFIYRLGSLLLKKNFQFHIIIEEDYKHFFFSLDNTILLGEKTLENLIECFYKQGVYTCENNKVSFVLEKIDFQNSIETTLKKEEIQTSTISAPVFELPRHEELNTFDILDQYELEDLEDKLSSLQSLILMLKNSSLDSSDLDELCICFKEIASILAISNDAYVISNSLTELSDAIAENKLCFIEKSTDIFDFINAFFKDLVFWKTKIFYEGAPSVDFLNDSIISNVNMLQSLLKPETEVDVDVDDIFDF